MPRTRLRPRRLLGNQQTTFGDLPLQPLILRRIKNIDAAGDNRVFVAALKMGNRSEATRLCRWMPVVRDRIQTVVSGVSRRHAGDGTPTLSLEKRRLKIELADALETGAPMTVDFVDAKVAPGTVLKGGESVVCDGKTLDRRRRPVFF